MKNREVVERFLEGKDGVGSNLRSDGKKLYSYNTCIAKWGASPSGGKCVYLLTDKFSQSTSAHQNFVKDLCPQCMLIGIYDKDVFDAIIEKEGDGTGRRKLTRSISEVYEADGYGGVDLLRIDWDEDEIFRQESHDDAYRTILEHFENRTSPWYPSIIDFINKENEYTEIES